MALHIVHELKRTGIYSRTTQYDNNGDITIKRDVMVGDIPTLACYIDDGAKKPLFLFYHGYTQTKESNLQIIYELAAEGFFVVAPDCAGHGQRQTPAGYRMCNLLQQTVSEVDQVIAYYQNNTQADTDRLFMAGASFGGMVTYTYLGIGAHPVKAAAAISSTPDLENILRTLPLGFISADMASGKAPFVPASDEEKAATYALAKQISPLNNYQAIAKTPLAIFHGTADEVLPLQGDVDLYNLLAPEADDAHLQLHHFEETGHLSSPDMRNHILDWFCAKKNA